MAIEKRDERSAFIAFVHQKTWARVFSVRLRSFHIGIVVCVDGAVFYIDLVTRPPVRGARGRRRARRILIRIIPLAVDAQVAVHALGETVSRVVSPGKVRFVPTKVVLFRIREERAADVLAYAKAVSEHPSPTYGVGKTCFDLASGCATKSGIFVPRWPLLLGSEDGADAVAVRKDGLWSLVPVETSKTLEPSETLEPPEPPEPPVVESSETNHRPARHVSGVFERPNLGTNLPSAQEHDDSDAENSG